MGMGFAPTWLRQVTPPASQNHFNHWCKSPRGGGNKYSELENARLWTRIAVYLGNRIRPATFTIPSSLLWSNVSDRSESVLVISNDVESRHVTWGPVFRRISKRAIYRLTLNDQIQWFIQTPLITPQFSCDTPTIWSSKGVIRGCLREVFMWSWWKG